MSPKSLKFIFFTVSPSSRLSQLDLIVSATDTDTAFTAAVVVAAAIAVVVVAAAIVLVGVNFSGEYTNVFVYIGLHPLLLSLKLNHLYSIILLLFNYYQMLSTISFTILTTHTNLQLHPHYGILVPVIVVVVYS